MKFPTVSSLMLLLTAISSTSLVEGGADRTLSSGEVKADNNKKMPKIEKVDLKIVGGVEVNSPKKYPYIAHNNDCGASLVAPNVLLSAAHCAGFFSQSGVEIGRHDLNNYDEAYETFTVAEEVPHPSFNAITLDYDYMMIRLDGFSSAHPVELDIDLSLDAGLDAVVMGWGTTSSGGSTSSVLLEAEVDLVSQEQCKAAYKDAAITDRMICAARDGRDTCQGDSGGPIIDKSSGKQIGIISWGYGCADQQYPGVYANVQHQIDWIKGYIDLWEGVSPAPTPSPTTLICDDGEAEVTVKIATDNFVNETSWTIKTASGDLVMSGDQNDYGRPHTTYTDSTCLSCAGDLHNFTINDRYGDGLCCNHGNFLDGSYAVLVNDLVVASGGEFGDSETKIISICANRSSSPAPPSVAPSAPPSLEKTDLPAQPSAPPSLEKTDLPAQKTSKLTSFTSSAAVASLEDANAFVLVVLAAVACFAAGL